MEGQFIANLLRCNNLNCMNLSFKQKIIGAVIAVGLILIAIFQMGLGGSSVPRPFSESQESRVKSQGSSVPNIVSGDVEIVSITPAELKEKKDIIIVPTQVIEMTFNKRLENGPETKIITDPPTEIRVELSDDHFKARIIPVKPYKLGQGFTLFLKKETKFEGGKVWGRDEDFHFTVIDYKGV